ncbi:universal stress protein family-domain-containing protein [Paraphysoderma sedebokerense]|nr:universal stress protein family-domain-containing protein [Paraphysoderma sedebokerense]KAI9138198.1 universal stress protein family-domain-containing protein [Paraphysoderma sedebokerense]
MSMSATDIAGAISRREESMPESTQYNDQPMETTGEPLSMMPGGMSQRETPPVPPRKSSNEEYSPTAEAAPFNSTAPSMSSTATLPGSTTGESSMFAPSSTTAFSAEQEREPGLTESTRGEGGLVGAAGTERMDEPRESSMGMGSAMGTGAAIGTGMGTGMGTSMQASESGMSSGLGKRTVIVTLDDSHASTHALNWALKQLVHPPRDHMIILTVGVYKSSGLFGGPEKTAKKEAKAEERSQRILDDANLIVEDFQKTMNEKLSYELVALKAVDNDIRDIIVDYVKDVNADLLVMGSHGAGALKKAILGSTSSYLLHHASCPVIIVKEQGGATAA